MKIEDYIIQELTINEQEIALGFVTYLQVNEMDLIKDNGYWKNKIYYLVKYKNECVCFIAIKDPDEIDNHWTVWSADMETDFLGESIIEQELKETAWKHVDLCGACGSCEGGRRKSIFGKTFEKVCGCTFRFDNPDSQDLLFMKKMVELRKKEIQNKETI